MTRTPLDTFNCSFARAVDILGDKWTLMILRSAMFGVSTFSEFRTGLGVAPAVLSDRLAHLCEHQVLERVQTRPDVDRYAYQLTQRGRELLPLVVVLFQWGDRWVFGPGGEPVQLMDLASQSPVQPVVVQARDGRAVELEALSAKAGPGASELTRRMLARAKRRVP